MPRAARHLLVREDEQVEFAGGEREPASGASTAMGEHQGATIGSLAPEHPKHVERGSTRAVRAGPDLGEQGQGVRPDLVGKTLRRARAGIGIPRNEGGYEGDCRDRACRSHTEALHPALHTISTSERVRPAASGPCTRTSRFPPVMSVPPASARKESPAPVLPFGRFNSITSSPLP